MSYAHDVRNFCKEHYIDPARQRGVERVEIVAGDVHRAMNYANKYAPAVEGPINGVSTLFRIDLL